MTRGERPSSPERPTSGRWLDAHDGKERRQHAEEEHDEQQGEVEVVRSGGPEDPLLRHVAHHDGTTADVHQQQQLQQVEHGQTRGEERAKPEYEQLVS